MTNDFVKDVRYFSDSGVLEVESRAGVTWQYVTVSPEDYSVLLAASSMTDAVRRLIHSGRVVGIRKAYDA
jgi:hypothetical protein